MNKAKVGGTGKVAVYGYNEPLGINDETLPLTSALTLKNMDVGDFMGMSSYDYHIKGYVASCELYGTDPQTVWDAISEN